MFHSFFYTIQIPYVWSITLMYGQPQSAPAGAPLVTFGVNSQGVWRLRFDLIHAYKMLFGLLDTNVHVFFH